MQKNFVFAAVNDHWESNGLTSKVKEPLKRWSVTYEGLMVHQTTGKLHKVEIDVRLASSSSILISQFQGRIQV